MTTATVDAPPVTDFTKVRHDGAYPQRDFYMSKDFYPLFYGGIGIGKTRMLVVDAFDYAWSCPGSRQTLTEPCYSADTEILTQRGWVRLDAIDRENDSVATLHGDEMIFEQPKGWAKWPFNGEMIRLAGREYDFLMTPQHRCWVKFSHSRDKGWHFRTAEWLYGKWDWQIRRDATWRGYGSSDNSVTEAWWEFYGLWFADGYAEHKGKRHRVVITQKKHTGYVEGVLAGIDLEYKRNARAGGGYNYTIYGAALAEPLASYGKAHTKAVPAQLKNANPAHLRRFIAGYWAGDGTVTKDGQWLASTTSKQLADDVQEMAIKAGMTAIVYPHRPRPNRKPQWGISLRRQPYAPKTRPSHWSRESYDGYVYCPKTSTGIVMVRRNGKAAWSGNTWQMVRDNLLPTVDDCYAGQVGTFFSMTRQPPIDIKFANGSSLGFRSVDTPDWLRGPNLARVLMDEVTVGKQEEAFLILDGRMRQPGYLHQLKATGTPKGRNWVWRRYIDKPMQGPSGRAAVFFAQTQDAEDAGMAPPGYTERLAESYGGWENPFTRQELGGAWVHMAGQVFPQFTRYDHVKALDEAGRRVLKDVMGGIDFGAVSPTALVAVGLGAGGRAWAFKEWYKREATLDETGRAMAEMQVECGITRWLADPAGKKEIEQLRAMGFKVQKARHGNKIKLRVQLVGARLNVNPALKLPGMFVTPECPNLIRELEGLSWKRTKAQGEAAEIMTDDFERGDDDHAFDGLADVIAEYDGKRLPGKRQSEPVRIYGEL